MIPVLTPEQMAEADRKTVASGVPAFELMQNAGRAVGRAALDVLGGAYGRRVTVVCGKGNNGGDGFVAARWLSRRGVAVKVVLTAEAEGLKADARRAFDSLRGVGVQKFDEASLERELQRSDLVVDAIVGTGFHGALAGTAARAAELINAVGVPVVAVDIPSGVDGATGAVEGPVVAAAQTVTLAALKPGLIFWPGAGLAGVVQVAGIGIRDEDLAADFHLAEASDVAPTLPQLPRGSNKRSVGKVLVVAGSAGMSGAAVLAAKAALRTGAGLVWAAVPQSVATQVDQGATEVIVVGLPETGRGGIEAGATARVTELSQQVDAVALGPGLSRDEETKEFIFKVLPGLEKPLVLDADGINAYEGGAGRLRVRKAPTLLTPHSGELARLIGATTNEIEADRLGSARKAARATGATVLLKGNPTVVARPSGEAVAVNTGGPVLATAGTGDVLTGVITALAAGAGLFEAAWAGAWLHGKAGQIAARTSGERGAIASDLLDALPQAVRKTQSDG